MKFDTLKHAPFNDTERLNYIAHVRKILMEREHEDFGNRPRLSLDWVERKYQPAVSKPKSNLAKSDAFSVAFEISKRIGIDGDTAFRIILCADDIILHWFDNDNGNRFRILDLSFEVCRFLGIGFDTVYSVLLEKNDL